MCRMSWNLGASTFRNPPGLSWPVMGLLYLLPSLGIINILKRKSEWGSVSASLLRGPCLSTARSYIFAYVLYRTRFEFGFGLHGSFHGIAHYLMLPSGDFCCTIKKKEKRNEHNQLFTVTLWFAVCAVGVSFVLILEFSERKEIVWWYPDCKVPLCMPECFRLYHTELNYLEI